MGNLARVFLLSIVACTAVSQTGCYSCKRQALVQSQLRTRQLYEQNQALAAERDQSASMLQSAMSELDVANQRLANLNDERAKLHHRYASLLERARNQPSPLSSDATRRFEELARRYPEFEFDPKTGISKFHSDILFSSGSDNVKPRAEQLLRDFAEIMNSGDTRHLNIVVAGHTDDRPISRGATKAKHPTNWHLSTNRANSVVLSLAKHGLQERRMGVGGYSMYQPVAPNKDDQSRQLNRRVEIYILAPDAVVAGWDRGYRRG